ncbi:MAG TPA: hypothetical protein VIO94_00405 [Phenylobacterium sp.]
MRALAAVSALALLAAAPAYAQAQGDLIVDMRLRHEWVDQDGFPEDANALTLRTRVGYETPSWRGFRLLAEGENVTALVEDYNSSTNGKLRFPMVTDPETTEVNRLQVSWSGRKGEVVAGRQRIILGNARYVGNVGFRQNEQTFDGVKAVWRPDPAVSATYAYVSKVRRIFGDEHPQGEFRGQIHLMQADAKTRVGQLTGYGYLLDIDNAPGLSSQTWGLRLSGARPLREGLAATYEAEYARQSDHGNAPNEFELDYLALSAGLKKGAHALAASIEWLDGDGRRGFQTPLATLHAFQGFADVFLTTPAQGVRDLNLRASTSFAGPLGKPVRIAAAAHDFDDADGGADFGREFDVAVSTPLSAHFTGELKAAFFDGDAPAFADRTKIWTTLEMKF